MLMHHALGAASAEALGHSWSWKGMLQAIEALVSQGGYPGVFLAMLVENVVQIIPSEVIMPLAGFLVYEGKLLLIPTILAGTQGTILGTTPWFLIGLLVNEERLEHYLSRHGAWFRSCGR